MTQTPSMAAGRSTPSPCCSLPRAAGVSAVIGVGRRAQGLLITAAGLLRDSSTPEPRDNAGPPDSAPPTDADADR